MTRLAGAWKLIGLVVALITISSAQSATPTGPMDPTRSNREARPRIFQAGSVSQSLQTAASKTPTQLSQAGFRVASPEEIEGMEQTLEKFQAAFENLSLPQVRQIWPEMDRDHEAGLKKVFSAFRDSHWIHSLGLECSAPRVTGETANVECIETLIYGPANGKSKQVGPSHVAILLKSGSNGWLLADMKGAN
jgi:hypothetical protein